MRILVLGASGMLGSNMLRVLSEKKEWQVFGSVRGGEVKKFFSSYISERLIPRIDVEKQNDLVKILDRVRPNVVINCTGLTKHMPESENLQIAIPINSLMPHMLAGLCNLVGSRVIHFSTDCVFSGVKGSYLEDDICDSRDVYGKTKALGEIDYSNSVTLRTSTIGHELQSQVGLLEWFLSQKVQCRAYTHAFFSGLPTVILSEIVRDVVIPHDKLSGVYNIAAKPISKYDLLKLVAEIYEKNIEIVADGQLVIDRSLDATKFRKATGYVPPEWPELIRLMHAYK